MTITIETPSERQIAEFETQPVWECPPSTFDWYYDTRETCYVLEGQVEVATADGQKVEFGAGDLVTFPQGLKCTWTVKQPIRKHYRFG